MSGSFCLKTDINLEQSPRDLRHKLGPVAQFTHMYEEAPLLCFPRRQELVLAGTPAPVPGPPPTNLRPTNQPTDRRLTAFASFSPVPK